MPRCDLVGLLSDGQLCGFIGAFEYAPKIVAYCEVHALKLCQRLWVDQVIEYEWQRLGSAWPDS